MTALTLRRLGSGLSLRSRLTGLFGVLFLLAGATLLGLTYLLFQHQVDGRGPMVVSTVRSDDASTSGADRSRTGESNGDAERKVIYGADGKILTGREAEAAIAERQEQLRDAATSSLLTQGGIALAAVSAISIGMGWLLAGRALGPLHRVTQTAARIARAPSADKNLHERINLTGADDEVKRLADTFDEMVERLDRSFESQRHFVANASHELRTPLAVERAMLEMAMHRVGAPPELKQLSTDLLALTERQERLISGLMTLAHAEQELTHVAEVDLADILEHVVSTTELEAHSHHISIALDSTSTPVEGDAVLLERLVHNLIENGIRHNLPEQGWVRVTCRPIEGYGEITVTNTGPVMSTYEATAIFEPFHRLGTPRIATNKGAGLGLSIARSITHLHGGDLRATPRTGGGLTVTARLPRTQPAAGS